ncbi:MAG TPA: SPFH domain-containing protein [Kineosporiaceae bacterium]|nr:SPFH domain-containing protein [Kineosporiaceae bacterium]
MSVPVRTPTDETPAPPAETAVGRARTPVAVRERPAPYTNGFLGLLVALLLLSAAIVAFNRLAATQVGSWAVLGAFLLAAAILVVASLAVIQPGRTAVVQFFGRYIGTVRSAGLVWLPPLSTRRTVSVRVRNFETERLKVNDADGNPVDIAAIVVWQIADTAQATFAVENATDFVTVQAEAALRHVARSYPYDGPDDVESLRGSTDVISSELAVEVAERVSIAGVEVLEVRVSHLAYSAEIAQAMLQRQQAAAVIAARSRIVEGAVSIVHMALEELTRSGLVELDEERRAAMVSNLLVVLCGDARVAPVINTGTLYQ